MGYRANKKPCGTRQIGVFGILHRGLSVLGTPLGGETAKLDVPVGCAGPMHRKARSVVLPGRSQPGWRYEATLEAARSAAKEMIIYLY